MTSRLHFPQVEVEPGVKLQEITPTSQIATKSLPNHAFSLKFGCVLLKSTLIRHISFHSLSKRRNPLRESESSLVSVMYALRSLCVPVAVQVLWCRPCQLGGINLVVDFCASCASLGLQVG